MATDPFKAFFDKLGDIEDELDQIVPELGEQLAQDIRKRTRQGYGTDTNGGDKKKLEALSDDYKKARRKMPLSSETSANKSNLTQTGSMLDSLKFTKTSKHQGLVTPSGYDDKGVSNAEKAGYAADQGRPFLFASKAEEKRLVNTLKTKLKDIIKKI